MAMEVSKRRAAWFALLAVFAGGLAGAQREDKDSAAILELGGAFSGEFHGNTADEGSDRSFSGGPSVAVEVTPIEHWLELEGGVTGLFAKGSTEWGTDLLFKKPWTLSRRVEFMAGLGPEWVHTHEDGVSHNSLAGEAALDFMFWPKKRRRFGWYLEPAYELNFAHGHEQSAGVSGGLLIAIP
jgi:hypothetical protein